MNCQSIISSIGFQCASVAEGVISVCTPFSFSHDGQMINLYVIDQKNGTFKVTDGMDTAFMLSSMNVNMTTKRITSISKVVEFEGVQVDGNGELFVLVAEDRIPYAITSMISACISVTTIGKTWVEKSNPITFMDRVASVLEAYFDHVETNVQVIGMSGYEYVMPLVVREKDHAAYINTIAQKNGSISWPDVTKAVGIMTDIKQADISNVGRFTVIDDIDITQVRQAETLLSTCSNVLPFSRSKDWIKRIAA